MSGNIVFSRIAALLLVGLTAQLYEATAQNFCQRDDLLVVVGNETSESESVNVLLKSRYWEERVILNLSNHELSSACRLSYPSRCSKLTVDSKHGDEVSSHVVFIPLEDGIAILNITHNGSALGDSNYITYDISQTTKACSILTNCTTLGIFKIRSLHYTLCVSNSSGQSTKMCYCQLDAPDNTEYGLKNCATYSFGFLLSINQISNVVVYRKTRKSLLYFFVEIVLDNRLENYLYGLNLVTGLHEERSPGIDCAPVNQITLDMEGDKLYIYCTNVSAVYYFDSEIFTISRNHSILHYPCSSSDHGVTVANLDATNETTTLTYTSQGGNTTVPLPGRGLKLLFGKCFLHHGNLAFLYVSQMDGVYLFDRMRNETFLVSSCNTISDQYSTPLLFNDTYFAVQSSCRDSNSLSLYSIENSQTPLLYLSDPIPHPTLVALISDLNVSLQTSIFTSTSGVLLPTPSSVLQISSEISSPTSSLPFPTTQAPPAGDLRLPETVGIALILGTIFFVAFVLVPVLVATALYCKRKRKASRNAYGNSDQHSLEDITRSQHSDVDSQSTSTNASTAALIVNINDRQHLNGVESAVSQQKKLLQNLSNNHSSVTHEAGPQFDNINNREYSRPEHEDCAVEPQAAIDRGANNSQLVLKTSLPLISTSGQGSRVSNSNDVSMESSGNNNDLNAMQDANATCTEATPDTAQAFMVGGMTPTSTLPAPHPDHVVEVHQQMEDKANHSRVQRVVNTVREGQGENSAPDNDQACGRQLSTTSENGASLVSNV